MADLTPFGIVHSYGGTVLSSLSHVASQSVVAVEPQNQVEAYEPIIGQHLPVDLYNGTDAPRRDVVTCEVLVRASDGTTDPVAAWQEVAAGVRLLQGLPETGTLVVYSDTAASGSVSCQARRKRFPIAPTMKNARHYIVTLTFTPTTVWT